ncbi:MAG: dethiobiotin synthase [Candidatus Scalindua sp. AMX11]|nr:MAG: dethiobiotin synthase [Candidatus Scalindua sp.]NOG82258.1 dethiobiotin synthase [Planctomycetota bacterium]RZV71451.1 MAG: dethiobiotin synthase [Candidatus Scalindua sp. SCAELEC01]TDE64285.1 MAG: dethiobiotin synthase [Candidatus Scalindua sp. AMX11]GJQ59924.1 MAG: ATP-dependent dethiobiotin synthetase BioD [Candidatus Scalindua sp.]
MEKGIFVTGSDTGVGKTVIAGALAATMKAQGLNVGVMKPVSTGARKIGEKFVSEDARYLKEIAGSVDELDLINPIRLEPPLAPTLAARKTGITIKLEKVWSAFKELQSRHDFLVVEGIGGLMVPIDEDHFVADMASKMDLPIVIVCKYYLGAINHTLLTVECAKSRNLRIKGLIINMLDKENEVVTEIEKFSHFPVLGTIPPNKNISVANCTFGNIVEYFKQEINILRIIKKGI